MRTMFDWLDGLPSGPVLAVAGALWAAFALWPVVRARLVRYDRRDHDRARLRFWRRRAGA